jgi:predicted type IV restriction endonuclease
VLTNGIVYRIFSDLEEPNKLDSRPFLEFNLLDFDESTVIELKKLTKAQFDQDAVLEAASELKFTREIKRVLSDQLANPADDFVRFFIGHVYAGRVTQAVKDQFTPIVQRAFRQFITDQVNDRLKSALERNELAPAVQMERELVPAATNDAASDDGVVTTEEEREGFHIVKAILREVVDPSRIVSRDVKSYFGILLDDNNRKPLTRLHFNTAQKYVSLFDQGSKQEERVPIQTLDEIYGLADRLRATVALYEKQPT